MPRTVPRTVVLVTLAVIVPLVGAAVENDGGSGGDAPDTASAAYPVAFGAFSGYLGNNADWYRVGPAATAPVCVTVASGPGDADADLEVRLGPHVITGDGNAGADAVLVSEAGSTLVLGVKPSQNPAANTPSRPGTYTMTTAARTPADLGAGDAGTGGDVGNDAASAHTFSSACAGGHVQSGIDARDVYGFTADAGDVVRLSYVQTSENGTTRLSLVDPDGILLTTLPDGGTSSVTLAKTGAYQAAVGIPDIGPTSAGTAATSVGPLEEIGYLVGFDLDDPGPQPCRPNCV